MMIAYIFFLFFCQQKTFNIIYCSWKKNNFTCGCIIKYERSLIFFRQQLDNGLSETFFGGGGSGKTMSPSSPTFQDERNMEPVFSGRGFIPPRNGWKWWRYHEMGDHEILDHLLNVQHYDRRETPPSQSKSILYSVFNSIFGNILLLMSN